MKRKTGVFAWCLLAGTIACAAEEEKSIPDLNEYSRPEVSTVFDESFNSDVSRWKIPEKPSFTVQNAIGETGSPGIIVTSEGKENMPSWEIPIKVKPGTAYKVSFYYRLNNLRMKDGSRRRPHLIVCSIHNLKDRETGAKLRDFNFWITADDTGNELRFYSGMVIIPENAGPDATFSIHVDWWYNGTFIYDQFTIATQEIPSELQLASPDRMTMNEQGRIAVRYQKHGEKAPEGAEMLLTAGDAKKLAAYKDGLFSADFGKLPGDKVKVSAVLFDRTAKKILSEHEWELNNTVPEKPVSYLDEQNRLIVDGKPFMPLGIYTMTPMKDKDFIRLQAAGFNLIQVQPMSRIWEQKPSEKNSENLLAFIDRMDRFGLKTLMFVSLLIPEKEFIRTRFIPKFNGETATAGIVREIGTALKGNPKVLGYYLADENIARELPSTQELRQRINTADPSHVTTTLTNSVDLLDQYVCTGDILLYDSYPFNGWHKPGTKGDLVAADSVFAKIEALNTPFWLVPQGFDWARNPGRDMYGKTAEEKRSHRIPSAEELTALPLLGAIHGAKGFVFYSYGEISHNENLHPGFTDLFWPRIVQAASVLKRLEPFIMSLEKPEQIELNVSEGALRSRVFSANGKTAVVIVALQDAPNAGTGTLPAGKEFISLYRRTQVKGDTFSFTSSGVDFDVLLAQ